MRMKLNRNARVGPIAFAALIALSCAACNPFSGSSSSPKPKTSTAPITERVRLKSHITLDGGVSGQDAYDVDLVFTSSAGGCRGVAEQKNAPQGRRAFTIPLPTRVGTTDASGSAIISPYHGPGVYGVAAISTFHVVFGMSESAVRYDKTPDTKASASISKDGSGTFTFSNLAAKNGKSESGTVRWTCEAQSPTG